MMSLHSAVCDRTNSRQNNSDDHENARRLGHKVSFSYQHNRCTLVATVDAVFLQIQSRIRLTTMIVTWAAVCLGATSKRAMHLAQTLAQKRC
jgi:hypothetical protein